MIDLVTFRYFVTHKWDENVLEVIGTRLQLRKFIRGLKVGDRFTFASQDGAEVTLGFGDEKPNFQSVYLSEEDIQELRAGALDWEPSRHPQTAYFNLSSGIILVLVALEDIL